MAHRKAARAVAAAAVDDPREADLAGELIGSKHRPSRRHVQAPGEIACYSGRNLDGWLQARNGRWLAFAADGRLIGSFASDRLGAHAIYLAAEPGGGR